jgi:nicotinate phosphoribosyltransferase
MTLTSSPVSGERALNCGKGMEEMAVFEFFARKLPPCRGFLMAAGLEQALDYLEHLRFTPHELD